MLRAVIFRSFAVAIALTGCAQTITGAPTGSSATAQTIPAQAITQTRAVEMQPAQVRKPHSSLFGRFQHVIIIFQENRTPDNLFNGLPGADTTAIARSSSGSVSLEPISLSAPYDISHTHNAFETEYDNGSLDGFNSVASKCNPNATCPPPPARAFGYVPRQEVQPYFDMAQEYTFADRMFQTNEGPSFPAHQYIISGTSTISQGSQLRAAENPFGADKKPVGGCDSPAGSLVKVIDPSGSEDSQPPVYPCFERPALSDLVESASLTWRYYQAHMGPGLWDGPDAILHIRTSADYSTHVVAPPQRILTDISQGNLANVVWVTPTAEASDHAGVTNGSGPSWVTAIVNAVGKSQYWNNSVIFVTWDDWGGWYDHVSPPQYNSYELGFRVPLVVISPYAKPHYVSHVQYEFGSILKFIEETFGLGSLGTTDVRSADLGDCFNLFQRPLRFRPIRARFPAAYFLSRPISTKDPDDDY